MKKLDFNIHPSNYLEALGFIQSFASAYAYLEAGENGLDISGHCVGCGSGGDQHHCKKDELAQKRCKLFFLFNTMCGNSALRRRFDGRETEMHKLTGDTADLGKSGGSDFTIDFLFGYTGYEYRKVTGNFKAEIVAAIDAGKPVIANFKNNDFRVVIGYDENSLMIPYTVAYDYSISRTEPKPEKTYTYDDIDVLYIFGEKAARRYTLINGLNNIRRVMEYNLNEGLWDEYLAKLGKNLVKASPEERKARAESLAETNMYMYNICSLCGAFCTDSKQYSHYLHAELWNPALVGLWNSIDEPHWVILNAGHKTGKLKQKKIWWPVNKWKIPGLSKEICGEIVKCRQADMALLEIIKQAIAILEEETI